MMELQQRRPGRTAIAGLVLAGLLLAEAPARASEDGDWSGFRDLYYFCLVGDGLLMAGGLTMAIGNGVSIGTRDRPSLGWIIPGFVLGGINSILGVSLLAEGYEYHVTLGLGLANLGIGLADLVLSTVALVKNSRSRALHPAPPSYRVSVAPLIAPDSRGGAMLGIGLRMTEW